MNSASAANAPHSTALGILMSSITSVTTTPNPRFTTATVNRYVEIEASVSRAIATAFFLSLQLRQHLDQLLQEQVAGGEQEVQQDDGLHRAGEQRLRVAQQALAQPGPAHHDLLRSALAHLGGGFDLLGRPGHLFHRLPQLFEARLNPVDALRRLGHPLAGRLGERVGGRTKPPSSARMTSAAPRGSGMRTRLRRRMRDSAGSRAASPARWAGRMRARSTACRTRRARRAR